MTAIVPLTLSAASDFVALWHRHLGRPVGGLFAVGIADADELVGAAIVGRPVARMMQDGTTAEVTRCCVSPGVRNGCSMLYGACWRAAKALGYRRLITYTQDGEPGRRCGPRTTACSVSGQPARAGIPHLAAAHRMALTGCSATSGRPHDRNPCPGKTVETACGGSHNGPEVQP